MSTLVLAITAVLGYGTVLFSIAFLMDSLQKLRTRKMLRRLSTVGSQYNLSFTMQEVLGNRVIGLDGQQGKLLFLDDGGVVDAPIDLSQARSCRIKKEYGSISYLDSIVLEVDLENNPRPVALPFYKYESKHSRIQEAPELEAKARTWEYTLVNVMAKEQNRA